VRNLDAVDVFLSVFFKQKTNVLVRHICMGIIMRYLVINPVNFFVMDKKTILLSMIERLEELPTELKVDCDIMPFKRNSFPQLAARLQDCRYEKSLRLLI
jgi:hypothetical protein